MKWLILLCLVFVLGCQPVIEYVEVPIYVDRIVEVEKIVTEVITVTEVVEVIKEVPIKLTDWELDELKTFLEQDNTDSVVHIQFDKGGMAKFANRCEVFALQLIDRAAEKGKRLFFVPLHRMEYYKWYNKALKENSYHAICGAIIGNEFWYIEPSTDRCWHSLNLE